MRWASSSRAGSLAPTSWCPERFERLMTLAFDCIQRPAGAESLLDVRAYGRTHVLQWHAWRPADDIDYAIGVAEDILACPTTSASKPAALGHNARASDQSSR